MSKFPDISVIAPGLSNGQLSFGGVLMGAGQTWAIQSAEGLDLPKVNTGDSERPSDAGQFAGLDFSSGRDITLTMHSQFPSGDAMRAALAPLEAVMSSPDDGATEIPLWFQRPGNPLLCCQVRPRQFRLKSEFKTTFSKLYQPIALLHATSAFVYGPTQVVTVGVPGAPSGFSFPFGFPLEFGGGSAVGAVTINNTGTKPARAVYLFTGPMDTPTIFNGSSSGNPFMTFDFVMSPGDLLVVDTDLDGPSAVYYAAGSDVGVSVLNSIVAGSDAFYLEPGLNDLVFSTLDDAPTAGTCEIMFAPTFPIGL